jgi:diguanylate cyclase (GGDEF)-like protein
MPTCGRRCTPKVTGAGRCGTGAKTAKLYAEILSVTAVKTDDGKLSHYLGVFSDITRLKAHEAELAHIAQYDMLTGVPNRRLLGDRMKVALARARREKVSLAVCMLDLDGFKEVNDRHGHDVGDRLLIEVARRMQSVLREDDSLARLGGDEFVFLLSNLKQPEECHSVLERMLRGIAQPMVIGDIEVQVSASIGLTLYPQDDATPTLCCGTPIRPCTAPSRRARTVTTCSTPSTTGKSKRTSNSCCGLSRPCSTTSWCCSTSPRSI